MKILVACEESQAVTLELRKLGHEAYSCDILPCSGGYPEWHLHQDVTQLLTKYWNMIIAFPPCTHLAASGARWFKEKIKDGRQQHAIDFFLSIVNANSPHIAIENPVGIMSTVYREPDQIIHPYHFGDPVKKRTCLWLKNLPLLIPTNQTSPEDDKIFDSGKRMSKWYADSWNISRKERAKYRSKTFPGIAKAMAAQWGQIIIEGKQ